MRWASRNSSHLVFPYLGLNLPPLLASGQNARCWRTEQMDTLVSLFINSELSNPDLTERFLVTNWITMQSKPWNPCGSRRMIILHQRSDPVGFSSIWHLLGAAHCGLGFANRFWNSPHPIPNSYLNKPSHSFYLASICSPLDIYHSKCETLSTPSQTLIWKNLHTYFI